jgi:hypothetical protein
MKRIPDALQAGWLKLDHDCRCSRYYRRCRMVGDRKASDAITSSKLGGTHALFSGSFSLASLLVLLQRSSHPAKMNLGALSSPRYLELLEPWLQRTSDRLSVGTDPIKALASLEL